MSDNDSTNDNSRRQFLRWLALTPGAAAVGGSFLAGCWDSDTTGGLDAERRAGGGADTGRAADSGGRRDTGGAVADTGGDNGRDSGRDTGSDTGRDSGAPGDTGAAGDAGTDAGTCETTGSDVEGPFFEQGAPKRSVLAPEDEPGRRIVISGTVYEPDCTTPVTGALLDVWHANKDGDYYDRSNNYRLRGQMVTDDKGRYSFESIRPGNYPLGGSVRPAHIHFSVHKEPGLAPLTTQLYFSDDPNLAPNDPCGNCNSGDPTLIIDLKERQMNGSTVLAGTFDIVLAAG